MTREPVTFGYRPRPPNDPHRGVAFERAPSVAPVPPHAVIDLRPLAPPARAQGTLGACTGFAGRGAVMGLVEAARRDGTWPGDPVDVSPLALYAEERARDGTLHLDEGATLARLIEVLSTAGLPLERAWPYDLAQASTRPPPAAWSRHRLVNATPLRHDLEELRAALADGCPLLAGIPCYAGDRGITSAQAFERGVIAMPRATDELVGWHAVTLWGHDPGGDEADEGGAFFVQNSWGGWADATNGIGRIPAAYVVQLANELYAAGAVR